MRTRLKVVPDDFAVYSDEEASKTEDLDWDSASNITSEGGSDLEVWRLGATLNFDLPLNVPADYAILAEAFSKQKATTLPPHRTYDCAINLVSGSTPPRGALYSLSIPESKAMKGVYPGSSK